MPKFDRLSHLLLTLFDPWRDGLRFIRVSLRPRCPLAAESLFLRKQLALYLERKVKPRRARTATKLTLVWLSNLFVWREALAVVKPDTLIGWHRQGFRLFWKRLRKRHRHHRGAVFHRRFQSTANAVTSGWQHEPTRESARPACGDAIWRSR